MVDVVQPYKRAVEGMSGKMAGKRPLIGKLRTFGRWLLWAIQEAQRRRAASVVRESARLVPPRSGGDHDV
jgi:hypothetical protein